MTAWLCYCSSHVEPVCSVRSSCWLLHFTSEVMNYWIITNKVYNSNLCIYLCIHSFAQYCSTSREHAQTLMGVFFTGKHNLINVFSSLMTTLFVVWDWVACCGSSMELKTRSILNKIFYTTLVFLMVMICYGSKCLRHEGRPKFRFWLFIALREKYRSIFNLISILTCS
jgi:hypothetical protein